MNKCIRMTPQDVYNRKINTLITESVEAKNYDITLDNIDKCISEAINYGATAEECRLIAKNLNKLKSVNEESYQRCKSEFCRLFQKLDVNRIDRCLKEFMYNDDEEFTNKLVTLREESVICERIERNHSKLNKRFGIEENVYESRDCDFEEVTESICDLISQYDISTNKKIGITLEECLYLNNNIHDDSRIMEIIVQNFLIKESALNVGLSIDPSNVVLSCPLLSQKAIDYYNESENFADSDDIKDLIKQYEKEAHKDEKVFQKYVRKMYTRKPAQVIDDTPNILGFIRPFVVGAAIGGITGATAPVSIVMITAAVAGLTDTVIGITKSREEAEKQVKYFNNEKKKIEKKISKTKNAKQKAELEKYLKCLDNCIDKLEIHRDSFYTERELDERINGKSEETDGKKHKTEFEELFEESTTLFCEDASMYLDDNMYMLNSLVTRCIDFIRGSFNSVQELDYDIYSINGQPIDSVLNCIDCKMFEYNFVSPNGIISIPLVAINDETVRLYNMYDFVEHIATNLKRHVYNISEDYTIISSDTGYKTIISLVSKFKIHVDKQVQEFSMLPDVKDTIANITYLESLVEAMEELSPETILEEFSTLELTNNDITENMIQLVDTAGLDKKEFIESLKDIKEFTDDHTVKYSIDKCLENISESAELKQDSVGLTCQLESMMELRYLVEAKSTKKSKDIKKKAIEKKKKIKSKLDEVRNDAKLDTTIAKSNVKDKEKAVADNVKAITGNIVNKTKDGKLVVTTNIALATQAMKSATKDLSTKEKAMEKSVDMSAEMFKRNLEKALTNNRREAIIKGSVIPSFSKMMKVCLATGAAWAVNPGLAVIGAISGLAVSKSLNRRERIALLDEIDIELKIVEKQIEDCDKSDAEKYRALLQYQRKLKREYERIKYRLERYDGIDTDEDDKKDD